ncbi:fimbrial protein [Salmonella enterica subsp. enterica serovar Braenderup]|nr:type 1 fimbrial protein [Salmonella enterica]EBQ0031665.1 type 1 fimbrial protein [Salmonella enterica subsp. enterica]EEC7163048.1 type 1 fimbrial protein [Salmonella enterica subsp. enterica serovar Braenderup]SUI38836.1 Fimbrial adapter papK precursor [Salmonella enterica subsp. enterica serovar Braenderup]
MKDVLRGRKIFQLAASLPLFFILTVNAVNVTFNGELLDHTCEVDPVSLNQTVQFFERPTKDFQVSPGKGPEEKFSIRLVNCDINSILKTVKLKFSGDTEPAMKERAPYFLRVSGKNQGMLAIGLLDTDGVTMLKLGEAHNHKQGTKIEGNTVILNFRAFVQATPDAITQKSVQTGEYSSVANFEIFYE